MNKKVIVSSILLALIIASFENSTKLNAKNADDYVINEDFSTNNFLKQLTFDSEATKNCYSISDGKLVNSNTNGWTNAIFGNQLEGQYSTLEFEITPHFENEKYSILNFQFRRWDNNTTYKAEITASYMRLYLYKFDLKEKQLLDSVDFGIKNDETSLIKIYTSGWYKSLFVNNQKLLEISEDKLSTGYFSFETWQTSFAIDNLKLDYVDDKTDLEIISLNNLKKDKRNFFNDLYDENDYSKENLALINTIKEKFLLDINNAKTNAEVEKIYQQAHDELYQVRIKQLSVFKEDCISLINNYVNMNDYTIENQSKIKKIINSKTSLINEALTFNDVKEIINSFENEVDNILSISDADEVALNKYKENTINSILTSYKEEDYSSTNLVLVNNLVNEFKAQVNNLKTKKLIDKLVIDYKEKISKIETKNQEDDKQLLEYRKNAINTLNSYISSFDEYSNSKINEINSLISLTSSKINSSTSTSEIDNLVSECKSKLDKVIKINEEYKNGIVINSFDDYSFINEALSVSNADDFEVVNSVLRQLKQAEVDESKLMFGGSNKYWDDFTLNVKIKPVYLNTDYSWGKIVFRSQSTENSNGSYIFNYKSNLAWISKMDDKGKEVILDCANIGIANSMACNVKIVAKNDDIIVFLDNVKVLACKDNEYKVGAFGFITWQTGYIVNSINISHNIDESDITTPRYSLHSDLFDFENTSKLPDGIVATRGSSIATDPFDSNNKVFVSKLKGYAKTLIGDANYKNFSYKMDLIPLGLEEDEQIIRLIFRANGWENNSYYIELTKYRYTFYACNNGNTKELASDYFEFQYKAKYEVEIRALDNRMAFYLQGNKMFDVVDLNYGSYGAAFLQMGNVGVQSWNGSYMLDNVVIQTITTWGDEPTKKDFPTNQIIKATDMELLDYTLNLKVNDTYQIAGQLNPTNADYSYSYISSDESIVSVTKSGFITALKEGEVTISVIENNSNIKKEIKIIVTSNKKGCKGEANSTLALVTFLSLIMAIFIIKQRKGI